MDTVTLTILALTGVQVAAYATCIGLARQLLPGAPDLYFAADAIYGLWYYPLVSVLASMSCWQLYSTVLTRWAGVTSETQLVGPLLVSRMVVHVPYLFLKGRKEDIQMRPMYLFHHFVVIAAYGLGAYRGKLHFWGAGFALCEWTNVFLTVIEIFACCEKRVRERWRLLYKWNSLFFGLSYCIVRLILLPVFFVWAIMDLCYRPEPMKIAIPAELCLYPLCELLIFGLSVRWSVPVIRGTIRTVFEIKDPARRLVNAAEVAVEAAAAVAVSGGPSDDSKRLPGERHKTQ
uniref:TLC domain-containing protein n=1 Tax=Rhizochromulina marina TaxID=1034831 RepID=A0A7S2S5R1_9STRA|mmetsp:Transcript_25522/g.74427  ORF Transcript_25522/g.74427 Transcript_25522/m.74427 type:complete len:289 (+) Transcript_25522:416-1282(+)